MNDSFLKRYTTEFVLAALLLILLGVGVLHHELWVDEARPWLIAKSTDWSGLANAAKLESHPVLWYAITKIAVVITSNPIALQLISAMFGFTAFLAILFFSPFSRLEKILLTTNLYLFFEYTLVARNYSLEMALLFTLCALFANSRQHTAAFFVICGLLSQSHIYGLLWSILFIMLLVLKDRPRFAHFKTPSIALASLFYTICAGASAWVLVPQPNQMEIAHTFSSVGTLQFKAIARTLLLGLFPVINPEDIYVTLTAPSVWLDKYAVISLLAILALIIFLLRKNRFALFIFVPMTLTFIIFSVFRRNESFPPRHIGQLILIILVAVWIGKTNLKNRALQIFLALLLSVQGLAGLCEFARDFHRPFSNGRNLATWLRQSGLPTDDIVFDGPFFSASFLVNYDTTVYNIRTGQKVYYWEINLDELRLIKIRPVEGDMPIIYTQENILLKRIKDLICIKNRTPLFIANYPADFYKWAHVNLELQQKFTGSIRAKEDFYVYKINFEPTQFCSSGL